MKKLLFASLITLLASCAAYGAPRGIDWAKQSQVRPVLKVAAETPNEAAPELVQALELLHEVKADLDFLRVAGGLRAQVSGGHSTALTWALSVDDTTTACTTTANCLQNVYRASGSCSTSSSFSLLTGVALSSTATAFTDSTITPGVWCYGVTFGINGLESAKDTVSVTLQPASPTGAAATTH